MNEDKLIPKESTNTSQEKSPWWDTVTSKVKDLGNILETNVSQASEMVEKTLSDLGETIASNTTEVQKVAQKTTSDITGAINYTTNKVGLDIGSIGIKTEGLLGNSAKAIIENPLLERIIDHVDLDKAQRSLTKLQQKYPQETSSQIAHRLMFEKATLASSSGLASSLLPGIAAALIALDLTAVAALQAEMVYQISGIYGFDLKKEERKGEVLAIFAIALGGSYGIKTGLKLLQLTPVIGAVVGASANATMIYSIGYAACKFYEAQVNDTSLEYAIANSAEASQKFLKIAIEQEQIMDQILIQIWLAGNPQKSIIDLLPHINKLNLSPTSVEIIVAIAKKEQEIMSVDLLLNQLNQDFSVSLFAQCEQLANANGMINNEQEQILNLIRNRLQEDISK